MIWLYALTDNPAARLPGIAGHGAEALGQTCSAELAGVWSTWSHTRPTVSNQDALWRQEAVLEALMEDRTVLPLRYGTVLEDVDALYTMITRRQEQWLRALSRVHGCVEMGIRASVRQVEPLPSGHTESGTHYLARRSQVRERGQAVADAVHFPLAAISSTSDANIGSSVAPLFTGSYLVREPDLDRFKQTVTRLARDHPELAVACTGPWPPYSFVPAGNLGA